MPSQTSQPAFVLVRPQMGENIGAAARAMWNFGLDRMRIVAPRDGWPSSKAVAMASGAGRLLDEARLSPDVPDALADCSFVHRLDFNILFVHLLLLLLRLLSFLGLAQALFFLLLLEEECRCLLLSLLLGALPAAT